MRPSTGGYIAFKSLNLSKTFFFILFFIPGGRAGFGAEIETGFDSFGTESL